ncbi:MAG: ribonuclease HII, partial [Ilumatobacteraceae bacterium]|nr:ribonuclease HII [Ilumatobacteraceae bacterium]
MRSEPCVKPTLCFMARPVPTLDYERELMATGACIIAGMDEVGRGAIAGPVTIGVVAIDATIGAVPEGLADSKLMTPKRREAMVPIAKEWGLAWATGSATAVEIDKYGIMTALSLAGSRALAALGVRPDIIIL